MLEREMGSPAGEHSSTTVALVLALDTGNKLTFLTVDRDVLQLLKVPGICKMKHQRYRLNEELPHSRGR